MASSAQSYKMVIKQNSGESITIPADNVDNVSFEEAAMYTVKCTLNNITSSFNKTTISEDMPFETTLIPDDGYYISSVVVEMGNSDITNTAYNNGKISIAKVTGNLIIEATALKYSDGIDLSANGTANCYIVSDKGNYKFSIGNYEGTKAFLLWDENGKDDITEVELKGSYIYFNKDVFNEGNAVVSLADAENHIVWSWHIWSTDEPQFIEINGQLWMDRNMGATDTTAGSLDVYGLWYNPGNPFPFPGPKYSDFTITEMPSVPSGWYVADGYGFYKSSSMPDPSKPMQLCTNTDVFGNSVYFRIRYPQIPQGCYLPSSSTFQGIMGYEPHIEKGGVTITEGMFVPCNSPTSDYGQYLCSGIYNTAAVDTYTFYFYEGVSKSSNYCTGAARLPIRCYKNK